MWMKIMISILLLALLALNFAFAVDADAMQLHNESFERAMVAFGLAKALNSVISLLQGTELSFTPVGVGLTFSIGELLDPLNDLVEQFSWVMLFASISLGIQKLLLLLSAKSVVQILLALVLFTAIFSLWVKRFHSGTAFAVLIKVVFLFLFLRFGAIVFIYSSQLLYVNLLANDFNVSAKVIEQTTTTLEELQKSSNAIVQEKKEEGFFDRMSSKYDNLVESLNLSKQLASLQEELEEASVKIINLITIFIVLSLVMPLLFLWLLIGSFKAVFGIRIENETIYKIFNREKVGV